MFALLVPFLLLRIFWRGLRDRGQWARWYERVGIYQRNEVVRDAVWVHAVSVGESMAAVPLIRALQERFQALDIIVTTTTVTGASTVCRMLGESVVHVFFPYDLPWVTDRFLDRFNPRMLIILETELWPNTIERCRHRGIPVFLANARLSQRSLRAYLRVSSLSRALITSFDFIAAQAPSDARRFSELGAAPDRLCVTGSLKFDLELPASLLEQAQALRRLLGVNRPVLTCGSTREGEEAVLVGAFAKLKARFPDLLVVLAPRHPERFDDVADFCRAAGFNVIAHSDSPTCRPETDIYLVDVMGDLPRFYAASDVAFVGGSLLPFGGHNVLEPAALGTPIVSGRYTYNFSEICELLQAGEVLQVVTDVDGFVRVVTNWLDDSNERDRVGRIGSEIVRNHRGATRRTVDLVEQVLAASGRADGAPLVAR